MIGLPTACARRMRMLWERAWSEIPGIGPVGSRAFREGRLSSGDGEAMYKEIDAGRGRSTSTYRQP